MRKIGFGLKLLNQLSTFCLCPELGLAPSNISVQTLDSGSLLISWDIPDEISSNVTGNA